MAEQPKPFGPYSLLALGINGIVGVGIFFAPAEVMALVPGASGALVYLLAALGMWPVAVVYGRLGRSFAEDGGPYVWARAAFGPLVGFCFGWLTYLSSLLSAAAVLSGLGKHLAATFGLALPRVASFVCLAGLVLFASLGLKLSALSLRALTVLKLLPLLLLLGLGLALLPPAALHVRSLLPISDSLGRATLLVVFALQGFEVVPVLAGRATSARHVQRATVGSLLICTLLYTLLQAVCAEALAGDAQQPGAPLVSAAGALAGPVAMRLLAAGQIISALGIAFGQVVTTPFYLAVLGKPDGLGGWLGHTSPTGVPRRAVLITASLLALLISSQELGSLFVLSSVAVLAQYGVAAASLLRLSREHEERRVSGMFWALLALCTSLLLASFASASELWTTLLVEAVGVALLLTLRALRARRGR